MINATHNDSHGASPESLNAHQPWCDQQAHASICDSTDPGSGCVGSTIGGGSGDSVWLLGPNDDDPVGTSVQLALDWLPIERGGTMTLTRAADLVSVLSRALAEAATGSRR